MQVGRTAGTVNATGVEFDVDEVHVLTLRDGKVVRFAATIDTPAMLDALGQSGGVAHGDGPRFRHLDELSWQECRKQQHGDHTASVWEKWLEFSPRYLSLYARWDPGMIVQPHGHNSDHLVFVHRRRHARAATCTARPGTHIALDHGDTFGPFVAGPDGVVLFEVMMGDPTLVPGRRSRLRGSSSRTRNVQQLPNPPIDLPEFVEDARN